MLLYQLLFGAGLVFLGFMGLLVYVHAHNPKRR